MEFLIRAMREGNGRSVDGDAKFDWSRLICADQFESIKMNDGTRGDQLFSFVCIINCPECKTSGSVYYTTEGMRIVREKGVCRHCGYVHSETDYSGDTWD